MTSLSNITDGLSLLTFESRTEDESLISSPRSLAVFLDALASLEPPSTKIYIDIEGINLCRHGSVSIIQIYSPSLRTVVLIDVHVLQQEAFCTMGRSKLSLKDVLESQRFLKYFFDLRNDSDALYNLYRIELAGVRDVQLLELAARRSFKQWVYGLAKCIEKDCVMTAGERERWLSVKREGAAMFDPEKGGSHDVFNQRPLHPLVLLYCKQDVQYLPHLAQFYEARLNTKWSEEAVYEALCRVKESQDPGYQPHGEHKRLGPERWRKSFRVKPTKSNKPSATSALEYRSNRNGIVQPQGSPKQIPTALSNGHKRKSKAKAQPLPSDGGVGATSKRTKIGVSATKIVDGADIAPKVLSE